MKKYELVEKSANGLYRIRALKDFSNVKAGDLGGFVEHESNLSQSGDCWVYDDAKVYDYAKVSGNSKVFDTAQVYGNARIFGNSMIFGNSKVSGNASIYENATFKEMIE